MRTAYKHYQQGIGMTEVLVAMLLLGVGVIGFSALQVRALSASHDAGFRSQASAIARDVTERMRMNPDAIDTYRNNTLWTTPTASRNACETATCTSVQLANYDIADVVNVVRATLPNGQINVRQCQNRAAVSCVYVSWNATTPTVGAGEPNCVGTDGLYVTATLPNKTDCLVSEG